MHPYSVAKMVTSLAYLHGRAVDLNMLAGGFKNDLLALGDETEHDDRYERTIEYTQIVTGLLRRRDRHGRRPLAPGQEPEAHARRCHAELIPSLLISGSSPAGTGRGREDRRARGPLSEAGRGGDARRPTRARRTASACGSA